MRSSSKGQLLAILYANANFSLPELLDRTPLSMLMFFVSRLLARVSFFSLQLDTCTDPSNPYSGWFTFLLPSYWTFKTLKQRPLDEREIEKWASYWIVIGALVAFEYTAEWLLSW